MTQPTTETNRNARLAKQRWGRLPRTALIALRELSRQYRLSLVLGDMLYLDERWYVSHAGLLRIAQRKKCSGINVECLREFSDPAAKRWAFRATLYRSGDCRGFVGYGDADPSNVSPLVHGAEMRRLQRFRGLRRRRSLKCLSPGPRRRNAAIAEPSWATAPPIAQRPLPWSKAAKC